MTDPRPLLHDIIKAFADHNTEWLKRTKGHAQHALDDAAHQAELEGLMVVLCENHDAFGTFGTDTASASEPSEVDSPGR